MNKLMRMARWLQDHRKKAIVRGSILSIFLLYAFFLAGPLFDRFERVEDEAGLHDVSLPGETNNIRYGFLEPNDLRIRVDENVIEIMGWAFINGQNSENSLTHVVLKSSDITYVFDTTARELDTTNDPDLRWAGFVMFIAVGKVKTGEYDVGIYIKKGDIEALQYTDKVVVKDGNTVQLASSTSSKKDNVEDVQYTDAKLEEFQIEPGKAISPSNSIDLTGYTAVALGPNSIDVSSTNTPGESKNNLVDDNLDTFWHVAYPKDTSREDWISIDLGQPKTISAVGIKPRKEYPQLWTEDHAVIQGSSDGKLWCSISSLLMTGENLDIGNPPWLYYTFDNPYDFRFYRILTFDKDFLSMAEFKLYVQAVP